MKVLHVINTLKSGGAEKLVSEIVPRICSRGINVDVCVFDGCHTPLYNALIKSGIRVITFNHSSYNPLNIAKLRILIRDYDIIHTHNTSPQLFAVIAGLCSGKIFITTEHSTSNRRRDNAFFKWIDKWMYARYNHVICISDKTRTRLVNYLPEIASKSSLIYNGISLSDFTNGTNDVHLNDSGKFIVTMVAGFRYQKDHETAVRAFTCLDAARYELWFVGDGKRRTCVQQLVEECGLSDNVRFLGMRTDVPDILRQSDVILQSSHIEGFGLAAVEGMAVSKPVIATDIDGLSQVVGGAGILVPHEDHKAIADEIVKLSTDEDYYRKIARQCAAKAQLYDIETMVGSYCSLYRQIISNSAIKR